VSFTPGPWAADLAHAIVTANGGRTLVCDCRAPTVPLGECYQAAEDARLIAAAPDLLAALVALADKVDATSDCDHKRVSCAEIGCIGEQVTAARAALRKARGQS
jgi:hypothetical protein